LALTREQRAAAEELAKRKLKRQAIIDSCHPMQQDVLCNPSRYKAVLAGRRSGKTIMVSRAIALALEESGRDDWVLYSALTRVVAKDLIWPKLEEINGKHDLGWNMRTHEGVIVTKRGAMFRILGYDDSGQIEKSAGYRVKLFAADEPHSYATKLKYLAEQKIGPALSDLRGTLMLTGTPGIARTGYWFDSSTGRIAEYARWHWTVRENPYFNDADGWIQDELRLRKWTVETPAFRREVLAEWCEDEGAMVYAFVGERNMCGPVELDPSGTYTMGVDFGVSDHSAWGVLYSPPHSRQVYVVHAESRGGLLPDEASEVTSRLVERFKPSRIVGDAGGLGKPYVEAYNRRYGNRAGWFMSAAEKTEKLANIHLVNGELRAGSVQIVEDWCAPLIDEVVNLVWADERREKEHPGCKNHLCDATLAYAYRAHTGYLNEVKPPPPSPDEAAARAQAERIERAQAALRAQRDADDGY
jgi:hypothetical protein